MEKWLSTAKTTVLHGQNAQHGRSQGHPCTNLGPIGFILGKKQTNNDFQDPPFAFFIIIFLSSTNGNVTGDMAESPLRANEPTRGGSNKRGTSKKQQIWFVAHFAIMGAIF